MNFKQLQIGKSVEITVIRDEYKLRLISKIEDTAEGHISVTLITGNGKRFAFKDTDYIQIVYKQDDRLWRWKGVRGSMTVLDGVYVHTFTGNPEGENFNRRNAYRIYLGEENFFHCVREEHQSILYNDLSDCTKEELELVKKDCACIIKDLSENGAGILTAENLQKGDAVSFEIITSVGKIKCVGNVVRIAKQKEIPYSNFYGIQFTQVSKAITKYVFAVQRLNLKNARR